MQRIESLSSRAPKEWRVQVTVSRGGRDDFGDPLPSAQHIVTDCLVGTQTTTNLVDNQAVIDTRRVLTAPVMADLRDGDRITVAATTWSPRQVYVIDGEPDFTPLGTRARLRKPEPQELP